MSAVSPSNYELITLQSADDPDRTVDIRAGVLSINYYESILSSAYSMKIVVVDTAESIKDLKTGKLTTIYQGLPLRGGERVYINVKANTNNNLDLSFIEKPLVVRGINNAVLDSKSQMFSLDLVSEEAIINEVAFVEKIYQKTRINTIVSDILSRNLKLTPDKYLVEEASNAIGWSGNLDKPFSVLNKLAAKSISVVSGAIDSSAGFFSYQTREKMNFVSIDRLCLQEPIADYFYTEININEVDFVPTADMPSLDRKITSYSILKNQDIVGNLKTGAYASTRRFFDPVTQKVTNTSEGKFNSDVYGQKPKIPTLGGSSLGGDIFSKKGLEISDQQIKQYFNTPSKILTGTIPVGTYSDGVTQEIDFDPSQIEAQKGTRYNTIFTQAIQVLVPLNSKLKAGDVISLRIPQQAGSGTGEPDTEISGRYLIKDLCHNYTADGSFTSMKVVRDTYGIKFS